MLPQYLHYLFLLAESKDAFNGSLWEHDCTNTIDCSECPADKACYYLAKRTGTNESSYADFDYNFKCLLSANYEQLHKNTIAYYHKNFPEYFI